ncbi:unnamed protein product [Closterium sp. Naga37s-1]|nr:unnamed protein product [Closterium sp. Naga37s-1]
MVIAGASEPTPELVAAWSAAAAEPPAEPERVTMATKPPLPPAPKPSTTASERTPPHASADPLATQGAGSSAPAAVLSAPLAAPGPQAPLVKLSASASAGGDADPPAPVHCAPAAPPVSVPVVPAPAFASSPKAASATTGGLAPLIAPSAVCQSAPVVTPVAPAGQPSRPPSPDRRSSRPHSPVPHQERKSSRRRRESPRRYQQQSHWLAHPGAPSPAVSAPAPGSRLHLPPVPPVAGVEFVAASGGTAAAPNALQVAAEEPLQFLAEALQPPQTRVPEATLGQLHRLADYLHALLLIQVLAHSSLPVIPPETFRGRQRDTCLDAADQLAVLLAPVLDAPAEGGAAAAGQLDEAVRGLRRHLRTGSGAAAIGASTLVVRELWRSLTGVLHALGAHRM